MKITKQKLVKIIKEELEAALEEGDASSAGDPYAVNDAYNKGHLDGLRHAAGLRSGFDPKPDKAHPDAYNKGFLYAYSQFNEEMKQRAEVAKEEARKDVGLEAGDAQMRTMAVELLKTPKKKLEAALEEGDASSVNDPDVGTDAYNKGYLDAYFELDEKTKQRAEDAMSQAVEELPYDASNADLDKRALDLLKPSKGGLGRQRNEDGIDF